jgi:predicted  nucleic acid-binding Zn-ribbon protein
MSARVDDLPHCVAMTLAQLLLDLQSIDTSADQLAHRREHSALRAEFATATERAKDWERRRTALRARIDELGAAIDAAETKSEELSAQHRRLEQQLRTVIAPREAEALMHEIATVESERDELDTRELAALEEQAAVDDQLAAHLAEEDVVTTAVRLADTAFAEEVADIEAELAALAQRREEVRAEIDDAHLATYDRKRAAFGVAVASLVGKQCQGCHLELSAAEIDTVKDEAAETGVADCPDCGRLLIV